MLHLVEAALGTGWVPMRSRNSVTPDFSAASVNLRLAVKVSKGVLPQHSTTTAPNPGQAAASAAVRSKVLSSGSIARITELGSPPNSTKPGM